MVIASPYALMKAIKFERWILSPWPLDALGDESRRTPACDDPYGVDYCGRPAWHTYLASESAQEMQLRARFDRSSSSSASSSYQVLLVRVDALDVVEVALQRIVGLHGVLVD